MNLQPTSPNHALQLRLTLSLGSFGDFTRSTPMTTSILTACLAAIFLYCPAIAQNRTEQTPITMEQLMQELRIQGGNFQFSFDKPVFARVTTEVADTAKGVKEIEHFTTDSAGRSISLFFSASALFVGDYFKPNQNNPRKMQVKLSDCKATEGTRIIHFEDRFAGHHAQYSPAIPPIPEVGKQYILHWYFKEGDPYSVKATIEFSEAGFTQ